MVFIYPLIALNDSEIEMDSVMVLMNVPIFVKVSVMLIDSEIVLINPLTFVIVSEIFIDSVNVLADVASLLAVICRDSLCVLTKLLIFRTVSVTVKFSTIKRTVAFNNWASNERDSDRYLS